MPDPLAKAQNARNQAWALLGKRRPTRKMRLFACCCVRRVWHLLDERSRRAVAVTELYADGAASSEEKRIAARAAGQAYQEITDFRKVVFTPRAYTAAKAAYQTALSHRGNNWVLEVADCVQHALCFERSPTPDSGLVKAVHWEETGVTVMKEQLALIHEMFGNPVASVDKARRWSKGIVSLASACYDGEDCVFALGDALDDEDHHLVAEHFRFGSHPKGCWALDLILGKK